MQLTMLIVIFIYGVILGSFYNVVGIRLPKQELFKENRSYCPNCHHRLKVFELIPLFSFMFQKGRCKHCQDMISWVYPVVECITGLLFCVAYLNFGATFEFIYILFFISFLIVLSVSDIYYMIIPNQYFFLFGSPLILFQIVGLKTPVLVSFLGLFLVVGVLCLVFILSKEKMGMGDVKLFLLLGFLIGPELIPLVLLLSSLSACMYYVYLSKGGLKFNRKIPFGPFISLGTIIVLFYGEIVLNFVYSYSLT